MQNKDVTVDGGVFSPRSNESPIVISSPVKGDNWLFINQSTLGYHFYVLFFVDGKIARGERFAFDNVKVNSEMNAILKGDPKVNESYFKTYKEIFDINGALIGYVIVGENVEGSNGFVNIVDKITKEVTLIALGLVMSILLFMF